jgi:photosystem II stability/assembly factor-like uncharacterized protein
MSPRALVAAAAALAAACALAQAGAAPSESRVRDVLDTPALKSPLASRALINGLARAGDSIVAVGQRGHALWSDDGGATWNQAAVPVSSDLVAVSFPTSTDGWAVGHDGVILHSRDAGRTWALQLDGRAIGALTLDYYTRAAAEASPADAQKAAALVEEARRLVSQGADAPLLDVNFTDASNGVAVGAFGLVLRTRDGGAHWEPWMHALDNPKGLHLYAVRAIADDLYIVGEQGLALKLDPKLDRMRALDMPYKGSLFGIVGDSRAIVVHGLRGNALRSEDGGLTWEPVATGLQVGLTASTRQADGRLVIVSQAGHVLVSTDQGAHFTLAKIERPLPAAAVAVAAKGELVVAGPRGAHTLMLP